MKYTLRRGFVFDGREHLAGEVIEYELDKLTGSDLVRIVRERTMANKDLKLVPAVDPDVQAAVFAEAAGKPVEFVLAMKVIDFVTVTAEVEAFLLGADSEESETSAEPSGEPQAAPEDT